MTILTDIAIGAGSIGILIAVLIVLYWAVEMAIDHRLSNYFYDKDDDNGDPDYFQNLPRI